MLYRATSELTFQALLELARQIGGILPEAGLVPAYALDDVPASSTPLYEGA